MLLSPLCLMFASVLGVPAAHSLVAVQRDTTQANTTQVPLTVDAVDHMATFWTAFMKEPPAVRDNGRKANQDTVSLGVKLNGQEMKVVGVNMVAMAQKFPSVVADLKAAGLTAQQWEDYRKALVMASFADQYDKAYGARVASLHKLPAVWRNVEFIRTHKKEYDALVATGMWVPKLRAGGGGGMGMGGGNDDLNP